MVERAWRHQLGVGSRDATRAQVVEAIDRTTPETKTELAQTVGISEEYVSELVQELKREGVVRKGYVVDDAGLYEGSRHVSRLYGKSDSPEEAPGEATSTPGTETGREVLVLLDRLESVTTRQYEAARSAFLGHSTEQSATTLEALADERYAAVLDELKSYTLTTDWPGNRVAADLSTVATKLELVGDRARFVADVVDREDVTAKGVVGERLAEVFASGARVNDSLSRILFDCELDAYDRLRKREESVRRDLDELFEVVTADDSEVYGYLVTVTRALERSIQYWVEAAELAVELHVGIRPDHADA